MGKPRGRHGPRARSESIAPEQRTQGSETSQYLEEKKSTEIPPVVASERGKGQTRGYVPGGCRAPVSDLRLASRTGLESPATAGDSPVGESEQQRWEFLSTTGHVQSGGNLGGPSSKPKYSLVTDSEQVP
jgi:hypothetical protein